MFFSDLPEITQGSLVALKHDHSVSTLLTDSRKLNAEKGAVFFAIRGEHHNGHHYLKAAHAAGVRQFVVENIEAIDETFADSNVLLVHSSLEAIQLIAAYHRKQFQIPIIGITGSNGKTIIKEWLYQLLSSDYRVVKNPGSYNSQLGVPLSVWQIADHHQLGIFEAGISKRGEMERLNKIIRPTIGVFSNIGSAHDEGFPNQEEKLLEKIKLFEGAQIVIYCFDHIPVRNALKSSGLKMLSWGKGEGSDIVIEQQNKTLLLKWKNQEATFTKLFNDPASLENTLHCIAVMVHLGYDLNEIKNRLSVLRSVAMRLELKDGINQCQIIDDTYNNDLGGLQISLDFLANQIQKKRKGLILSDVLESGLPDDVLSQKISRLVEAANLQRFVGIGPVMSKHKHLFPETSDFYDSTEAFLSEFKVQDLRDELILVKGARSFQFERIIHKLQRKVHGTVMEVDLGAIVNNLNYFKSLLLPTTKIMVMVKAFAYGSGSIEIASLLQYHHVDYLGVAYADEGIELRKNNITTPIMVMNPSEESFDQLLDHKLEPEIYSFKILESFLRFLNTRSAVIHLKLDTGMHRLGFSIEEIPELCRLLKTHPNVRVGSVFSHLAGADEAEHDAFSKEQAKIFSDGADIIAMNLGYKPLLHLLNSPGILRLPAFQFDMVRLGIGLYGVNPTGEPNTALKPVATLKTFISQIRKVKKGETIGYGRRGSATKDLEIATIAIGYADGFNRAFSRGVGSVLINGKLAPVIGNVCMDMTMVDVSGCNAHEGDEVIIFGKELPINDVAAKINTIPYEILTNTSERVKRVFVAESI